MRWQQSKKGHGESNQILHKDIQKSCIIEEHVDEYQDIDLAAFAVDDNADVMFLSQTHPGPVVDSPFHFTRVTDRNESPLSPNLPLVVIAPFHEMFDVATGSHHPQSVLP